MVLRSSGTKKKHWFEQIKLAVIELVHNSTYNAMVRNSDYLVERFGMSYPYIFIALLEA